MTLDFNLDTVKVTEFGIGRKTGGETEYGMVPVDVGVQSELLSMVQSTLDQINAVDNGPTAYNPAEKHGGNEYLIIRSDDPYDSEIRKLHEAENLAFDNAVLSNPETIVCYFARLTDDEHRHLTAIKRATQFKGVLKNTLARIDDDTLKIVNDDVFKLDRDFDVLLDSTCTHIWRPSAFEALGGLKEAILAAVPANIKKISSDLPFIDFTDIEEYAKSHLRAAGYVASIRSQSLQGMDQNALVLLCNDTGVFIRDVDGSVKANAGSEMGLLEVLDRRRYQIKLVQHQPERFRASSRVRIDGN